MKTGNQSHSFLVFVRHQVPHQHVVFLANVLSDFLEISANRRKKVEFVPKFGQDLPSNVVDDLADFKVVEQLNVVNRLCA